MTQDSTLTVKVDAEKAAQDLQNLGQRLAAITEQTSKSAKAMDQLQAASSNFSTKKTSQEIQKIAADYKKLEESIASAKKEAQKYSKSELTSQGFIKSSGARSGSRYELEQLTAGIPWQRQAISQRIAAVNSSIHEAEKALGIAKGSTAPSLQTSSANVTNANIEALKRAQQKRANEAALQASQPQGAVTKTSTGIPLEATMKQARIGALQQTEAVREAQKELEKLSKTNVDSKQIEKFAAALTRANNSARKLFEDIDKLSNQKSLEKLGATETVKRLEDIQKKVDGLAGRIAKTRSEQDKLLNPAKSSTDATTKQTEALAKQDAQIKKVTKSKQESAIAKKDEAPLIEKETAALAKQDDQVKKVIKAKKEAATSKKDETPQIEKETQALAKQESQTKKVTAAKKEAAAQPVSKSNLEEQAAKLGAIVAAQKKVNEELATQNKLQSQPASKKATVSDAERNVVKQLREEALKYASQLDNASQQLKKLQSVQMSDSMATKVDRQVLSIANLSKTAQDAVVQINKLSDAQNKGKSAQPGQLDSVSKKLELISTKANIAARDLARLDSALASQKAATTSTGFTVKTTSLPASFQSTKKEIDSILSQLDKLQAQFNKLSVTSDSSKSIQSSFKTVSNELARAQKAAKDFELQFAKITQMKMSGKLGADAINTELKKLTNTMDIVKAKTSSVSLSVQAFDKAFQSSSTGILNTTSALNKFNSTATKTPKQASVVQKSTEGMSFAFIKAQAIIATFQTTMEAMSNIMETVTMFERMKATMTAITGSYAQAQEETEFMVETSRRLGVEIKEIGPAYAKLLASAKGTSLAGEEIRKVAEATLTSARVLNLTGEQTKGMLYALQQMVSKGTVSMEELRLQLAERLPGALRLAAASMKMSTKEFYDYVSAGKLASDVFLPKFSEFLIKEFGPGMEIARTTIGFWQTDLQNAATLSKKAFSEPFADDYVLSLKMLSHATDEWRDHTEEAGQKVAKVWAWVNEKMIAPVTMGDMDDVVSTYVDSTINSFQRLFSTVEEELRLSKKDFQDFGSWLETFYSSVVKEFLLMPQTITMVMEKTIVGIKGFFSKILAEIELMFFATMTTIMEPLAKMGNSAKTFLDDAALPKPIDSIARTVLGADENSSFSQTYSDMAKKADEAWFKLSEIEEKTAAKMANIDAKYASGRDHTLSTLDKSLDKSTKSFAAAREEQEKILAKLENFVMPSNVVDIKSQEKMSREQELAIIRMDKHLIDIYKKRNLTTQELEKQLELKEKIIRKDAAQAGFTPEQTDKILVNFKEAFEAEQIKKAEDAVVALDKKIFALGGQMSNLAAARDAAISKIKIDTALEQSKLIEQGVNPEKAKKQAALYQKAALARMEEQFTQKQITANNKLESSTTKLVKAEEAKRKAIEDAEYKILEHTGSLSKLELASREAAKESRQLEEALKLKGVDPQQAADIASRMQQAMTFSAKIEDKQTILSFMKDVEELQNNSQEANKLDNELIRLKAQLYRNELPASMDEYITRWEELQQKQLSTSWFAGFERGFDSVTKDIDNFAKYSENSVVSAFGHMSDALEEFARTGKLNFSDMTRSILADIAQMAAQAAASNLFKAAGSALGSLFGTSSLSGASTVGSMDFMGPVATRVYHTGGIVGVSGGSKTTLPLHTFANAPRFHNGGGYFKSDEYPAVLQYGERVLNRQETAAYNSASSPTVNVNVYNETNVPDTAIETTKSTDANGNVEIRNLIISTVANNIQKGGAIKQAMNAPSFQRITRGG